VFTKGGAFVTAYGGGGTAPGRFQALKGMDYHNGLLYTIEQSGERVQVFSVSDDGTPPPPGDSTPPDGQVIVPSLNQVLTSIPATLSGTATDNVAVSSVDVAIRDRGTLQWWNGSSWQSSFTWLPAALTDPGTALTDWSYDFDPANSSEFIIGVRASDTSGNTDPTPPWVSFEIDEGSPPPPPDDTTPPDGQVTVPTPNQVFTATPVALSGTATDNLAVSSVNVAIRDRGTLQWWNGSSWQSSFTWLPTALTDPGTALTDWSYPFSPPNSSNYVVGVRTIDTSGNVDPTLPWIRFSVS
jgi:hypothetical protein